MGLGNRINEIRKKKKIGIDQLCEKSGVPKGTLSKITAGITTSPTLDTVKAIARALECTLDDLDDYSFSPTKSAPLYSSEAMKLAKDYDSLDKWGQKQVRVTMEVEIARCKEAAIEPEDEINTIKIQS